MGIDFCKTTSAALGGAPLADADGSPCVLGLAPGPLLSHKKCFWSRFTEVNSPTNPSTYPLLLLVRRISWRNWGGIDFCKRTLAALGGAPLVDADGGPRVLRSPPGTKITTKITKWSKLPYWILHEQNYYTAITMIKMTTQQQENNPGLHLLRIFMAAHACLFLRQVPRWSR